MVAGVLVGCATVHTDTIDGSIWSPASAIALEQVQAVKGGGVASNCDREGHCQTVTVFPKWGDGVVYGGSTSPAALLYPEQAALNAITGARLIVSDGEADSRGDLDFLLETHRPNKKNKNKKK